MLSFHFVIFYLFICGIEPTGFAWHIKAGARFSGFSGFLWVILQVPIRMQWVQWVSAGNAAKPTEPIETYQEPNELLERTH